METQKTQYFTSDLMKTFGIGRNTLRLYEEKVLLSGMKRTLAGYRTYTEQHVLNLKFILAAKKVGFTLSEVKALLETLHSQQTITCGKISQKITGKVEEIEKEILILKLKKSFLNNFLITCKSKNKENNCDVITSGFDKKACC